MSKRTSYEIKKEILYHVREEPATYAILERKINTGYRTVRANCEELAEWGQITITPLIHPANGRTAHHVSITKTGAKFMKQQRKK